MSDSEIAAAEAGAGSIPTAFGGWEVIDPTTPGNRWIGLGALVAGSLVLLDAYRRGHFLRPAETQEETPSLATEPVPEVPVIDVLVTAENN